VLSSGEKAWEEIEMILKRNKEMIHFSGRRHSKTGIASAVIGILVVLGFLAISIISGLAKGNGSFILGVIGSLLFVLSVSGFILSYKAFKKKDIFYRFPVIGAVLNGFMTILLLIIYILGI
jgi:hypothetical protein